ncbi:carbon-nitrogen hydrolase family protein [Asanoa sp. WMMD1127]|uniref:carbon-nitrogen hydrolase family protein n=1 Tax=Asanoa sp. WMMD1127 TaxID=3016107 RepID=UPI002415FB4F|nr:carbon-nitrogen hydrolase family protein [Asanoa sp. WMMD1127]MDG4825028.1 carbon-nitrogen hydrolase family protein [Asanoa sp. WMMD1127]
MQRAPLTIAVAQPHTVTTDVAANATEHATAIRTTNARVVVFPELSLTGYALDAPTVALDDPRLTPIVAACAATGTTALAGAPVDDDAGRTYIATLAIDGGGARVVYRKTHLHHSEERFSPGDGPAVLVIDAWRLGLAICRDTAFPEHDAAAAALGMDVYVASVLDHSFDADTACERAQRVTSDHGTWVAVSSFAGSTGGGFADAAGRSGIWAPDGGIRARAGSQPGEIAKAVVHR